MRLLIMTGEASGDQHGAKLATELYRLHPGIELFGLGGKRMAAAGVRVLEGIDRLDIIGLPSIAEARQALLMYRKLSRLLAAEQFDAVVLIDNPGLNLRLARVAKRAGHRVVYFVTPQIWAWHASRIKTIKRYVDLALIILPFEEAIYRDAEVPYRYVGHPLLDDIKPDGDRVELRSSLGIDQGARLIGLLPGSRMRETSMLLPIMLDAAKLLVRSRQHDDRPLQFVLGQAASLPTSLIDRLLAATELPVIVARDRPLDVMAASDLLIVASGTATLQSAVVGTPMLIVYRGTPLTALFARWVVKVKWLGLANLVAGRTIAPELLQEDCSGPRIAAEAARILNDDNASARSKEIARELREKLGATGAARRAAEAILDLCARQKPG